MYKSTIQHSWRQLSTIEKFNLRDTSGAVGINDLVKKGGGVATIENIVNTAVCAVHNDQVKPGNSTDYTNYYLIDSDGVSYYTSSETLYSDIDAIVDLMADEDREVAAFSIVVKEFPSKTQQQGFMKASLKAIIYTDGESVE